MAFLADCHLTDGYFVIFYYTFGYGFLPNIDMPHNSLRMKRLGKCSSLFAQSGSDIEYF
jgi:hypothetical protein